MLSVEFSCHLTSAGLFFFLLTSVLVSWPGVMDEYFTQAHLFCGQACNYMHMHTIRQTLTWNTDTHTHTHLETKWSIKLLKASPDAGFICFYLLTSSVSSRFLKLFRRCCSQFIYSALIFLYALYINIEKTQSTPGTSIAPYANDAVFSWKPEPSLDSLGTLWFKFDLMEASVPVSVCPCPSPALSRLIFFRCFPNNWTFSHTNCRSCPQVQIIWTLTVYFSQKYQN